MCLLKLLCISIGIASAVFADQPVVNTQYGRLRGLEMRSKDSAVPVMAFLGIPYAQPPVGDLRLALPQQPSHWEGERDATHYGPACPQFSPFNAYVVDTVIVQGSGQSEDCLHLDVYTPGLTGKRPVLVVIHGGGFLWGSSSQVINGSSLAAHEDIVVVSMNYRLGALGNLYNADGAWPSNLGLRDQQFALRWVQDNIAAFGGDPDTVTLNGESAGAVSVSAQILAPSSGNLFKRAILQSGSIFSVFNTKNPQELADQFVASLGCLVGASEAVLECIRTKSVKKMLEAQASTLSYNSMQLWDQVWDGDFLPSSPIQAYKEGSFSRVDCMSGVTTNEGFIMAPSLTPELFSPSPLDLPTLRGQLATALGYTFGTVQNVQDMVDDLFGSDVETGTIGDDAIRCKILDILGGFGLQAPPYFAAKLHAAFVPNSYFYEFDHQPSFMAGLRPSWHRGCDHLLENVFIFGLPLSGTFLADGVASMDEEECTFSKLVMKYIANFVKKGNPNGEDLPMWDSFTGDDENFLILKPQVEKGKQFRPDSMKYWTEKLGAIRKQGSPTQFEHEEL